MARGTEALAKTSAQPRSEDSARWSKPLALPGATSRRRLVSFSPKLDRRVVLANYPQRKVWREGERAPAGVEAEDEPASVYPNWRYEDLRFVFQTRASRRHRWLTGPRGFDDMVMDRSDDAFFVPPPTSIE